MYPPVGQGQVLAGRYQLGPLLGQGGMARVYDGVDTRLHRPVAVKVLLPELSTHPEMRQRFEREALSAARLSHPNAVAVYDAGEDRGVAYLVMERLPGRTLADRIAQGPMPVRDVITVAGDVLAALGAAHALGMVHRDIKPGNILLTDDGRAKVADFGIAKSVDLAPGGGTALADITRVGLVVGTPAYLAPERMSGRPATAQADLYSLGVVLYEALTGRKPLAGEAGAGLGYGVPAGLAAVIRRALSPRPEDRYPSAAAMAADLASGGGAMAATQVLRGGTSVMPAVGAAVPPTAIGGPVGYERGAPPPPPRASRRRWWAALGALLAAAALVAAIVAATLLAGPSGPSAPPASSSTTTSTPPSSTTTTASPTTTSSSSTTTSTSTTTTSTSTTTSTTSTTLPGTTLPGPGGGPTLPGGNQGAPGPGGNKGHGPH